MSEIMELPKVLFIRDQLVFMAEQTILVVFAFAFAFCSLHDLCLKHICIFRYPRKFVSVEVLLHPTAGLVVGQLGFMGEETVLQAIAIHSRLYKTHTMWSLSKEISQECITDKL